MTNELPFFVEGDEQLPVLVLLHDLLGSCSTWSLLRPYLLNHYRLVFVELWGHGGGVMPEQIGAFSPSSYIEELEIIRHILGVPQWSVLGLGYGGALAVHYAFKHPKAIKHLSVCDIGAFFDPKIDQKKQLMLHELRGMDNFESLPQHPKHFHMEATKVLQRLQKEADNTSKIGLLGAYSYYDTLGLYGAYQSLAMPVVNFCATDAVLANRYLTKLAPQLTLTAIAHEDRTPLPLAHTQTMATALIAL